MKKKILFGLTILLGFSIFAFAASDKPQKSIPADTSMQPVAVIYVQNPDGTYTKINANNPLPISWTAAGAVLLRKEISQDLNSGALDYTTDFGSKIKVKEILFHAASPITQTVTFTFDSKTAGYDTVLASEDLAVEQDYAYLPDNELILESGDEINITCTAIGAPAINVYTTIIGEVII